MKKYCLLALVLFAAAATSRAQSFTTSQPGKPREQVGRQFAPVTYRGEVGAFVRARRGGNPIQLLNPRAPWYYRGVPSETVTYDPYNPSHITGIILFGLRW